MRQTWSYSLVDRDVYNVETGASPFILNEAGTTLLSQVSQVVTLDYRDSKVHPHTGYIVEVGTDFAGLGGDARFRPRQCQRRLLHPAGRQSATRLGS